MPGEIMDWIEVNGVALRYELCGEGRRTVVLMHEMGGSLETWDLITPRLCQAARVLRYDLRGAGMSEKVRGELKIETLADDARALLDALQIFEPVVLAGCAVGAAVAICFAARHPQRTAGLVAMSPSVGVPEAQRQSRLQQAEDLEQSTMRSIVEDSLGRGYPPVLRARDPERFGSFRARWLGNDPGSFVATSRMLIRLELDAYMQQIRCPTLVIGGSYDSFRPPASSEGVARRIPGARFRVLEAGHHMPVQTPDLVYEALDDFLHGQVTNVSG
jgi:3-oxoadipate enol-lactonase